MPEQVLVINGGSSSLKFALIDPSQDAPLLTGLAERLATPQGVLRWQIAEQSAASQPLAEGDHEAALAAILPLVQATAGDQLVAVGHRVVHGGDLFTQACVIDDASLAGINAATDLAPLHNPANLDGIAAARAAFPSLPHVAVFDTAFHQTMPEKAYRYAVPEVLYREQKVRRYGFHGTSHHYVSREAARLAGLPLERSGWLVAHLGNGCSTCAVQDGQSRDTSMGLTPLEGVVMGTRSGDVDPNLHGYLHRQLGWSLAEIDSALNHRSGLLGLSGGLSNDMRTLTEAAAEGHQGAALAIEVFCYRLAKSLGAMACALTRLDGVIFTGGIGENAAQVRAKTIAQLGLLGVHLDEQANHACVGGRQANIAVEGSPAVWVVPTNEERQIAIEALALVHSI